MKVIINSDILFAGQLIKDTLPRRQATLFRACVAKGHTIVIPLTTSLEFQKNQARAVETSVADLEKAYRLLTTLGVPYTRVEPSEIIVPPDLLRLIQDMGGDVVIESPTLEDLMEAHRRACLHEPPQQPDTKSDEMRDLVIWMIALRLAKLNNGALLVSSDEVHVHARGDSEAASVSLERARNVEDAMEYFDVETPAGRLISQILAPVWDDLANAGLPIAKPMSLRAVLDCRIKQGIIGPSFAHCSLKTKTLKGEVMQATADIDLDNGLITKVELSNISVEGKPREPARLSITPNKRTEFE